MTCLLRKMRAQDRIEGRQPLDWGENNYAVVDEARFGRIYMGVDSRQNEWRWLLQTMPASPPNSGVSETLDEAKAALVKRYEEVPRSWETRTCQMNRQEPAP